MTDVLHITNGDSAVELMHQAGITGTLLPWRDVLHEEPAPAGLELAAFAVVPAGNASSLLRSWPGVCRCLHFAA